MAHKLLLSYWMVERTQPPFGDAQSPTSYKLGHLRGEETLNYSTVIGYRRHIASLLRSLTEDDGRIIDYYIMPSGSVVMIYRPGWETGPHAAPHGVIIPPCHLDSMDAAAAVYELTIPHFRNLRPA